ncbi:MAG: GDSL-type esterase/lipase family protein [Chloroflexota bacterium]
MMFKHIFGRFICVILVMGTAACQPSPSALPTLAVIPTMTPQRTIPATIVIQRPTLPPTWTPTHTASPTHTPTSTGTATATATPTNTITPTDTLTPTPIGDAVVSGESGVNLRIGPSIRYNIVTLLDYNTPVDLIGQSQDGNWYQAQVIENEQQGWVYAELITLNRDVGTLPITWTRPTPPPPPTSPPVVVAQSEPQAPVSRPVIRQRAFSKVGDSITANQAFMLGYDGGEYDLGVHGELQSTIDAYRGSFARSSLAAAAGFNAPAVLDPIWATDELCLPEESPLACEYRVHEPDVAIILLGGVDVQLYRLDEFDTAMKQIVDYTISRGIVPVLTTFPTAPSYYPAESEAFNQAIRQIAQQKRLPLIDLRSAVQGLPDGGLKSDGFHLTERGDYHIDLNGEQNQYGLTMRNFVTLQTLHSLR